MKTSAYFAALLLLVAPATCPLASATTPVPPPTSAWPRFPAPGEVLTQPEEREYVNRVLQQTASGLFANHARKSSAPSPYVWIEQARPSGYARWLQLWQERTHAPTRSLDGGAWALVRELQSRNLISGYVLYRTPGTGWGWGGGRPYSTRPPNDLSVNFATALCGPLNAVAIEERQQPEIEALGLKQLADCRTLDFPTLFKTYGDKLNPLIVASLDPRSATARDMAVACDAPVIINCPGGGVAETFARSQSGGFVFGWGLEGEDECVRAASRAGLEVVAANWSYNLPLLASSPVEILPQTAAPSPTQDALAADQPGTRYVAFIESDGDNITWTMSNFAGERNFYAHPDRGSVPFGWSMTVSTLAELGSDAWNHYVRTATPNDDFVHIGMTGYGFLDVTPHAAISRQATLLNAYLEKANVHSMIAFTDKHWDSAESRAAYQNIVDHCPTLHAILPLQYMPYAAGQGKLLWANRDGKRIPILPPRTDIWDIRDQGDFAAPPDHVAQVLNRWAAKPANSLEDTYSWVIVHAWSDFHNGVVGLGAAKACAAKLDPNIKVIKPSELVERLYLAANPE